jgi:hypothetical protein
MAGCSSADTVNVTLVNPPVLNLGNDTTICFGQQLTLNAGNPGNSFLWSTGATTQSITINQSGTYWVDVTNTGCTVSDTIVVSVINASFVNLGNDTTICSGTSITLDPGIAGAVYAWSTGNTNQTITV